jgi:hypothetical protein
MQFRQFLFCSEPILLPPPLSLFCIDDGNDSMFYQSILLLIFRPFRHLVINAFSETPRQISVNAAIEICTIYSHYQNAGFDSHPLGMIPHTLLSAAHVFLQEQVYQTTSASLNDIYLPPTTSHLEQCIVNLRKMATTWDLSGQTLHVIWSRAAGIELPNRIKKALYPETMASLAATQTLELEASSSTAAAAAQQQEQEFSEQQMQEVGTEYNWMKSTTGDVSGDLDIAASVADLLGEVENEVSLDIDGWADPFGQ